MIEAALMLASESGHQEIVKILIDAGADVNATTEDGQTALMLASQNGHQEIVNILIDAGADVNATMHDGWTALIYASNREIINILIDAGADVNATTEDGFYRTALIIASESGQQEIVKILIDAGANVNISAIIEDDGPFRTALMLASESGQQEIVKILIDAGADVNATAEDGQTALTLASQNGHQEIVNILIDAILNPTTKNVEQHVAGKHYTYFKKGGHIKMMEAAKILEELAAKNYNINEKDFINRDEIYQYLSKIGYKWIPKQKKFKSYNYKHPSIQAILLQVRSASDKALTTKLPEGKTHGKQESGLRLIYNNEKIKEVEIFILDKIKDFFKPQKNKTTYYTDEPPHHENTLAYIKGKIEENDTINFAYKIVGVLEPEAKLLVFNERAIREGYTQPYIDLTFYITKEF